MTDSRFRSERVGEGHRNTMKHPPRKPWGAFPDAVILASEPVVKRHPEYKKAKSGDASAAARLVEELIDRNGSAALRSLISKASGPCEPEFVCVQALEDDGINAIPAALAEILGTQLDISVKTGVVQTNIVAHTGASGYGRLARQARFEGRIDANRKYVMVDDFIGQGGTLANLRGRIALGQGTVVGAVVLTGKPYSARLRPLRGQLDELRQRHGLGLEEWWQGRFGHSFDCLTQSEARYLTRSPDADTIRNRLATAEREGDHRIGPRGTRKR